MFFYFYFDKLQFIEDVENINISVSDSNTQKNSRKHSDMFERVLVKHNFEKKEKTKHIEKDGLYYICQPNGTQKFPDFWLVKRISNLTFILDLELKSGSNHILWNDGFPQENALYLYSCKKDNITRLFTGKIVDNEARERYTQLCQNIKTINKTKKYSSKNLNSNFSFYTRKAISQTIFCRNINDRENILNSM